MKGYEVKRRTRFNVHMTNPYSNKHINFCSTHILQDVHVHVTSCTVAYQKEVWFPIILSVCLEHLIAGGTI